MRTDRGRYTASVITRKAAIGGSSARETNRTLRVLRYRTLALPRSLNSRLPVGLNVNVQVLPLACRTVSASFHSPLVQSSMLCQPTTPAPASSSTGSGRPSQVRCQYCSRILSGAGTALPLPNSTRTRRIFRGSAQRKTYSLAPGLLTSVPNGAASKAPSPLLLRESGC